MKEVTRKYPTQHFLFCEILLFYHYYRFAKSTHFFKPCALKENFASTPQETLEMATLLGRIQGEVVEDLGLKPLQNYTNLYLFILKILNYF